ncbi:MAG: adenylate kinase [Candidatus Altiarchaeales archaeon]|nr:adenylate kinase [Candidatus Altiarchaeota archaeon]MBU4265737.1 adenylate kinase [Candidatus Altiarchaeota archaeon]MBU4341521.1 adenylate kinase [Candidatus Altiarchaeota archaeon]MBU4436652.1 adenylate kinase [Candidatus Altiarchaeota archaeon]MCG2783375.1 adenylate kinase [Candidatus Altiarchaeales archaeon]
MLAIMTGIPGTGKTTVAKKAIEKLSPEGIDYELITYGDVMADIAITKNLVHSRDEMRKLEPKQQKEIQELAAVKISQIAMSQNVLLDTHCAISTPQGYLPGLPEEVLRKLSPNVITLIEARPEEIVRRRQSDETRERDEEMEEAIALHQWLNRSFASAYSVISGATVMVIENPQGKVDEAAEKLMSVLR